MSPTALKVTKRAVDEGSKKSLAECLITEYRLSCACLNKNSDFAEGNFIFKLLFLKSKILLFIKKLWMNVLKLDFLGVRALLIDKDQKPVWNPKSLKEVSDSFIEQRFRSLPSKDDLKLSKL